MKTLILMRHADSTPATLKQADFDRPLSSKGKADAAEMGKRLLTSMPPIDAAISSSALRAKTTAEIVRNQFATNSFPIQLLPSLYEADVKEYYAALETQSDTLRTITLIAHNPGISYFILEHLQQSWIDMVPGAVFCFEIATDNWPEIRLADWKPIFYSYP